jgi:hypothetical protein
MSCRALRRPGRAAAASRGLHRTRQDAPAPYRRISSRHTTPTAPIMEPCVTRIGWTCPELLAWIPYPPAVDPRLVPHTAHGQDTQPLPGARMEDA